MNTGVRFDAEQRSTACCPPIHRIRDAAARRPGPAAVAARARSPPRSAVMEENLEQLYDDLFVETCADWAVPYIGDLIGYEPLHALGRARGLARAEVAHTIALRRRKGTVPVLEQLARDVTGWNARAVEYFQLLATTQYMNHLRPFNHYAPDLRRWEPLARIGGAFESIPHTVDVRRIESGRGRFNIPNVGIFLWRLGAYRHTRSPAVRLDDRRWFVSPLGQPLQLFTNPIAEDEITHLAEPINVPDPIGRRTLRARKAALLRHAAGAARSRRQRRPEHRALRRRRRDRARGRRRLRPARRRRRMGARAAGGPLRDRPGARAHRRRARARRAGERARRPTTTASPRTSAAASTRASASPTLPAPSCAACPDDDATIGAALAALGGDGVVEITDSGRYEETLAVVVQADGHVIIRAAEQCRPTLVLGGALEVTGGAEQRVHARRAARLRATAERAAPVPATGSRACASCTSRWCPGSALDADGDPVAPGEPSVVVERAGVAVEIDHAIVGALRVAAGLERRRCGLDRRRERRRGDGLRRAGRHGPGRRAVARGLHGDRPHQRAPRSGSISNSLLLARARRRRSAAGACMRVQRQTGCVRFTFLPLDSLVPRRHRCQPEAACVERRTALHHAALRRRGVLPARAHDAWTRSGAAPTTRRRWARSTRSSRAQRETNLQIRLREYLRVGLAAGILYAT